MQNSIQNGQTILLTPADDIVGGGLVVFKNYVAIAITDIPAGETGACAAEGVFELPKGAVAFEQGQAVYAGADGALSATEGEGLVRAGVAWAAVAANEASVQVKINA